MRPSPALAGLLLLASTPSFAQHEGHQMPQAESSTATPSAAPDTTATPEPSHHAMHVAQPPLPAPTAAERAAAFPDMQGMDMRDHMDDDPFTTMLQVDQLEWRDDDDGDGLGWDVRAWTGYTFNRVWLRSEGVRRDGDTRHGEAELLWGHAVDPWWDVVAGVRHDFGGDVSRDWVAIGVHGLAPYKFEVEATAYVGESGRLAAKFEAEYDVLLSNRLILQPKVEATAYSRDDIENHVGKGLSDVEFGLRLRYEWHRQFAPYFGYTWSRRFGRTADLADDADESTLEHGWVAGVRVWF